MKRFNDIQPLLSYARRAVDEYEMISDGDKIAVGVSGGKDSLTLLCIMQALSLFYPKKYELYTLCLDVGFPNASLEPIKKLCEELEVPLTIVPTEIYKIVFEYRQEKNPCSLCARMRRGALHDAAKGLGCNKIALGHHFDDAVETFMMNLYNEGRIGCFSPKSYLDRKDITLIRPMVFIPEKEITGFINKEEIEIVDKMCPADGKTDREQMKNMLKNMSREDHGLKMRIFGAMKRKGIDGW